MTSNSKGCSCSDGCCAPEPKKELNIDFLYLDLNVCERCKGAKGNLDQAIQEVSKVLKSAGYTVATNKVHIVSEKMAVKYKFLSSPTIRINGRDVNLEVRESTCKDCGDLCGDTVNCRTWVYEGVDHEEPPKEMIVSAIMKAVFGSHSELKKRKQKYILPKNLKIFFKGFRAKQQVKKKIRKPNN